MHQTIPEFYAGQKILVTGGTGFMGKVLVEKILRSCPDVDSIYLIVREKKGKPIDQRWREITQLPLFDQLKVERPESLMKIKLIPGDMGKEEFGLSPEDIVELRHNITIIFHTAADIQFSESINDALQDNVKGVKTLLDLAKTMVNLKVFVHISTAYSNYNMDPSKAIEKILPACQDWKVLLKLQENEPEPLQLLKEKLLCGHPNPYTWSKSLAEQIVNEYSIYFPVVVMRPSVVLGCIRKDPLEGWQDVLGGFTAMALAGFLGVLRVLKANKYYHNDHIPVDIATRAELIAAKKAVETNTRISVYNLGISKLIPVTYDWLIRVTAEYQESMLIKEKVFPESVRMVVNDYTYPIVFLYRQILPAVFLDVLLKCFGQKPMFIKISIKLANGNKIFKRFLNKPIIFPNQNFEELDQYLNDKDKEQFSIDISDIALTKDKLLVDQVRGILKYALKADLSEESIEKLRPRYERIKLLSRVLTVAEYSIFGWLTWCLLKYMLNRLAFIL